MKTLKAIRLPTLKNFFNVKTVDMLTTFVGIAMIGVGLYEVYPPAMFIIIGGILAFPGLPKKAVK